MTKSVLRIDSSARYEGSVTRDLADRLVAQLTEDGGAVVTRDLSVNAPSFVNEAWVGANFTDAAERTEEQVQLLVESEALVQELEAADTLVIGVPIYNFGVPAALKAWVDMVARARRTFRYTENGPEGLLTGKKAYLVVASGGTAAGSEIDFATGYMRHVLGFIGITDVTLIAADQLMVDQDAALAKADAALAAAA
ncbi:MAG: NAD(P)H-dependent oxidoreductase [Alphaproteobacteria bacterium]|nr:NAD(P)H-dependent oxidoreductase [Alphaproteobacteria bacterium SS10]